MTHDNQSLGFVGTVNNEYVSTIQRVGDDVIIVGSTLGRAPAIHPTKCGCGREMMIVSTLPKASALKFDTCTPCFNKARYTKYQAKLATQFEQVPQAVKDAYTKACQAAVAQSAARRVSR